MKRYTLIITAALLAIAGTGTAVATAGDPGIEGCHPIPGKVSTRTDHRVHNGIKQHRYVSISLYDCTEHDLTQRVSFIYRWQNS